MRKRRSGRTLFAGGALAALIVVAGVVMPSAAFGSAASGTGLAVSTTTAGHLTSTYNWTIAKSSAPAAQTVAVGSDATVDWTITTTKSASGTIGAYFDGTICVTNAGGVPTQGLAISDRLSEPPSTSALITITVDVSAEPVLGAGASHCYPYKTPIPSAAISPGATYKDTAHVTITNYSGSLGKPTGPSPSATAVLPFTPTMANSSITVTDTNGKSFVFSGSGAQTYAGSVHCSSAETLSPSNTATISETNQQATASTSVVCADKGNVRVTLTDGAGHTLAGAAFELISGGGIIEGVCATGSDGVCTMTNVPQGSDTLRETSTPGGYATAADTTVTITGGQTTDVPVVNTPTP